MTVDLSKIRPGDELTIRVFAWEPRGTGWTVRTLHDPHGHFVEPDAIVSHTPKALSVGDRATWRVGPDVAVLAINDDRAWVKSAGGGHWTAALSDLERIP